VCLTFLLPIFTVHYIDIIEVSIFSFSSYLLVNNIHITNNSTDSYCAVSWEALTKTGSMNMNIFILSTEIGDSRAKMAIN
jgi:hypothetical protein